MINSTNIEQEKIIADLKDQLEAQRKSQENSVSELTNKYKNNLLE